MTKEVFCIANSENEFYSFRHDSRCPDWGEHFFSKIENCDEDLNLVFYMRLEEAKNALTKFPGCKIIKCTFTEIS